jgi:DNA polymerase III subunit gamma/tau
MMKQVQHDKELAMVFYRKYRPQTIEELDSKEIRDKLHSVLESPSSSHAFLFTGPKGLGKTSAARIVAKSLNCEKKTKSIEPCNKCDQCTSITNGTNLDILEIDGASNRGIDEIRDLREKIRLSPISARKKVYIIDEVHMLTTEAFNALLKTLEEPPSHVVFVLCTTESHKVPATIQSRCLQVQFKKATAEELVRSFERIAKAEKFQADKKALNLIAGLSDGSFRDGVKILEEMVSGSKEITTELVEQKYQISSIEYQVAQLIRCFEDKDTKRALSVVAKLVDEGVGMGHFLEKLILALHNSLLLKAGVSPAMQNSEFKLDNLKLEMQDLKKLIELLSKAHSELKYAIFPQLPLELVIVEWGLQEQKNTEPLGDLGASLKSSAIPVSEKTDIKKEVVEGSNPAITTQQGMADYNENNALWMALIDKVKAYNHTLAGVLRGCRIKSYDGKSLVINANFKFHKDKLSEPKTHDVLEKACKEITKKDVEVEVVLKPAFAKASAGEGR